MSETINDLYLKYAEGIGESLESDRYFQYLFEMVQAGENTLQQKNRILHKVVDERWIGTIEEGIDAIFNIIDKPRRFVTTKEEVVPVALARKITADSVRHLSMNTQFIASDENGEIQPTRILNVSTEESFDLYENRFVYHLIQRLFTFVDKRTDVIFWSAGDEICNTMSMESKVDDAYEEISYKVEMTIKNRQSYAENDSDHMEVFKRIDRLRRLVRDLRNSSFCELMAGCARVQSPIQRTNLMMKDPSYRACYKLWQFIESYDEVGYTIEEQDSALEFDEEYLLQMYINLITNYTVFKSLLESDPRSMHEIAEEHREPVKPKFIKEIKEEIVEDRDIPDVEIRKVFVEEVTQAQIEAEEKLQKEIGQREELERTVSDLNGQVDSLNDQMEYLEEQLVDANMQLDLLRQQLDESQAALAAAGEETRQAKEQAKEAEENLIIIRQEAKEEVEAAKKEAEEAAAAARQGAAQEIKATRDKAQQELEAVQKAAQEAREKAAAELAAAQAAAKKSAQSQAEKARREADAALEKVRRESGQAMEKLRREADSAIAKARNEARTAKSQLKELEEEKAGLEAQLKKMEKTLASNRLSRYLVNSLKEHRDRKHSKEGGS
ncbi:DUF2357 domain-containing protein [Blautia sp. OF03-15BH]|uniref:DUF2357 domain-containing protein n=1 Tax=Blautia sp. OF03-15BH TaxID=2292287 RepID=UPI000E5006A4|nr:DUF2357 domain-containing protein [Blautia sp. OF03-15BH]RGX99145.1 DUF2357 domain-containing protein [Blautia sp. OF03-15BH]